MSKGHRVNVLKGTGEREKWVEGKPNSGEERRCDNIV